MSRCKMPIGLSTLFSLLAAGCSVPLEGPFDGAGGKAAESTESISQELTTCSPTYSRTTITHEQAAPFVGPSTSTHMCWASTIELAPVGFREGVDFPIGPELTIRQVDGNWQAYGYGEMRCVTQCAFFSNGGNADVRWVSQDFVTAAIAPAPFVGGFNDRIMWDSDAMALMTTVEYFPQQPSEEGFQNLGPAFEEFAEVAQEGCSGPSCNLIQARAYTSSGSATLAVWGYSFFVGRPHTGHNVNYDSFFLNGLGDIQLIPDSQGICSFARVAGVLPSSFPRIYRTGGVWRLQVMGTTNHAKVQANCFYFDQNQ